ncbi:hypothetical protein [Curtobacterium sp. MCBD17_040]|uniref:hypothetical protein n=1 Tax=Curtobacterium sp. MCBD17_040 TaxID=2175674 RepID=UPI000DA92C65|nr:hypothetical protein [Curtobacterium sp. MCBD17_040]WIB65343.1 hypothetical protein DEI94_18220 [Curtobacterium sp. MCBD17_040]
MTTFNEFDHPRGDAGKFTEKHFAEANVALAAPDAVQLGEYAVKTAALAPLPEWPSTLPDATLAWTYDDNDGQVIAAVTVGDDHVFTWELDGDVFTSIDEDPAEGNLEWSEDERSAVIATAVAAHQRARDVVGQVEYQATKAVEGQLNDIIAGKPVHAAPAAAVAEAVRAEAEALLASLHGAQAQYNEDTNDGADESSRGYEALEDARLDFADRAETLLLKLLGR